MDTINYHIFEGMTSISALIGAIIDGKNDRKIIKILYDTSVKSKKIRELGFLTHKASELGFELIESDTDTIDRLANGKTHGGIIALCSDRTYPSVNCENINKCGFYALIDGVEDPYNFGYCVRSLYAAGADGLILPERNWMSASGVVAKSAAGTSELFDIFVDDLESAVDKFKSLGFKVVCAEIRDSVSLYDADLTGPILFIVGGEKRGISGKLLSKADINIRIEYERSFRGSLPTASAVSIIAFHAANARKSK